MPTSPRGSGADHRPGPAPLHRDHDHRPGELRAELATIRRLGYAESDGEVIPYTYGLAAPILTGADRIVAALGASAPSTRLDAKSKGPFLKELSATARAIARELVGQDAN